MKNNDKVSSSKQIRQIITISLIIFLSILCVLLIRDNREFKRQVGDIQSTCHMYEDELMELYSERGAK